VAVDPSTSSSSFSAEEIFRRVFAPLYPPDALENLALARTTDANPANNPHVLAHLDEAAEIFAANAKELFGEDLALDFSDASVHRLGAAITRARRDAWLARPDVGTADSPVVHLVVHGTAYVGACAIRGGGGARDARWSVRRPLWESLVVLRSPAGEAELALFQWWLKSLADEAFEPGGASLADRYRMHVEVPTMNVDALPRIAPGDRKLPRITKPRYDVLYKHLKAHLPELKDLGKDFPSPERFADIGFQWLDLLLLGDGRMLVMAGPGEGGLHVMWLGASGFEKAAFYPADKFPEPIVRVSGDKLQLLMSHEKKPVAHELLWWGV
jgi:hypothetical protein